MSSSREGKIYVGNLPNDIRERDIEDLFYKFGKIASINLKMGSTDLPFAFIEFEDPRDARDAISDRDGYNFQGYSLRVERPHGGRGGMRGGRGGYGGPPPYRGRSDYRSSEYSRGSSGGASNGSRRSDYRVLVSGLPASGSWQDLKDHMREAGDVCYTDVFKDGTGVVEFVRLDDMKYAVRKLDDSKFRSHEGESSRIRVKEDYKGGHSRSRSRSHSPVSRSRSRRSSSR